MKHRKFNFFESYHRSLSRANYERYGRIVYAISAFVFDGEEPAFSDDGDWMLWDLIWPIIENGIEISKIRSESGAKGGASGKGVSRNLGNKFASKDETLANKSKTIAKEKYANEESIATESQNNSGMEMERKGDGKEMEWECEEERIKPTHPQLEEVVSYFNQHDPNKVSDAQKFFNHFSSLGWAKNGQPIVNWQSRADMWISEDVKKSAGKPSPNEAFNWKPPTEEEKAQREVKRHEDEYNRFKGTIDLVRENPQSLAYSSLLAAFKNGILDKYPTLKEEAKSLLSTRDLQ